MPLFAAYGARPVRRAVRHHMLDSLASRYCMGFFIIYINWLIQKATKWDLVLPIEPTRCIIQLSFVCAAYGARPVRRAVRHHILDPLAQLLIGDPHAQDGATVLVDVPPTTPVARTGLFGGSAAVSIDM